MSITLINKIKTRWRDWRLAQAGIYAVEIDSPAVGLFAQLSGLMGILQICERRNLLPYVVLSGKLYIDPARGRNFLEYYFDGPEFTLAQRRLLARQPVRKVADFPWLREWSRTDYPTLQEAGKLWAQYYQLKPEIVSEVEQFVVTHFESHRTLGVHFRGTDKWQESTYVDFETTAAWIRHLLATYPHLNCLFVATDSQPFLDFVTRKFRGMPIITYQDEIRSSDHNAVHLSQVGNPYRKGRDALMNALLLARTDRLLKCISNLSGWSKVFNPALPIYLMNHSNGEFLGFPEREMVQKGWFVKTVGDTTEPPGQAHAPVNQPRSAQMEEQL